MQTASFYHMLSVIYLLIIARTIVLVQIDFLFQFVLNHDMLLFTPFSVTLIYYKSCRTSSRKEVSFMEEILVTFLVSVLAGIVSYYICNWLDGRR